MNLSLNEFAYRLWESIRGEIGDDDTLSLRLIKSWIHDARSTLLKQKFQRRSFYIDRSFIQFLRPSGSAISMEKVDSSIIEGIDLNINLVRTTIDIPKAIERPNSIGTYTRIAPAHVLGENYKMVTLTRAIYSGNSRYTRKQIFAFEYNNRIYLYSKSNDHLLIKYLDIEGVFENPEEVHLLNNVNGSALLDFEYPITRDLARECEKIIFNEKLRINAPTDKINDGDQKLEV